MKPIRMRDLSKRAQQQWSAIAQGAPELLDDLDMQRAQRKPSQRPERDAQRKVVTYLRKHLPRGSLVFSNNNTNTTANQRLAQMADGMLPGLPDLTVITAGPTTFFTTAITHNSISAEQRPTGRVFMIEMKAPKGRLSETQERTQQMLRALGIPVFPRCTSVDEAVEWLRSHGVAI